LQGKPTPWPLTLIRPASDHGVAGSHRAAKNHSRSYCGLHGLRDDPKKHIVFNQSQVAEHAEPAWVFNCVARLAWLNRMTRFKEKAGKGVARPRPSALELPRQFAT